MVRYHTEKGREAGCTGCFSVEGLRRGCVCNSFSFDVHKGECLAVQIMDARMEERWKIPTLRYFTGKWRTPVEWEADRDSGKLQDR